MSPLAVPTPLRRRTPVLASLMAFATMVLAMAAPSAQAGSMRHYICGSGFYNVDGWTGYNRGVPGGATSIACPSGSGITADLTNGTDAMASNSVVGIQYAAPANTTIGTAQLNVSSQVGPHLDNGASIGVVMYRDGEIYDGDHVLDQCQAFGGCAGINGPRDYNVQAPRFLATIGCGGQATASCAGGNRGFVRFTGGYFELIDSIPPVASGASGSLLQDGGLRGVETLAFNASDQGVGVAEVQVKLGNTVVVPRQPIDFNGGKCKKAFDGYPAAVPCLLNLATSFGVDTRSAANGEQVLTVSIWDAAGNGATAVSRRVTVANPTSTPTPVQPTVPVADPVAPGGPNGTGGDLATASLTPKKKLRKVSVAFDRKTTLTGRLRDAKGKAVAGAVLDVFETAGGVRAKVGTVTTSAKGTYRYLPKTDVARVVEIAYSPQLGGAATAAATFNLKVRFGVSLSVSRSTARRGQAVRLRGKVTGPLPKGGMLVELSALSGKTRIQFKNVRTRKDGTFSYSRKFKTRGAFRFQARTIDPGGLALERGSSAVARLRIR